MDEVNMHMKGRVCSNRDKDPVHPPPPPPPPLPSCSNHTNGVNRAHSVRSMDPPSVNVISEEINESSSRRPYFNTMNFERPRLIRRDRNKLSKLYSGMYARLIIVFTVAFVLNEILNKKFSPYFFQGFLFLYLFGGSVLCMMIIYCFLLRVKIKQTEDSFKRQRTGIPEISVYLRIGVLIFGLGTLLFNGLEVAIVFMTERRCTNIPGMALPVLQAFFTFVQMHFIFTDSRKALKKLGWFGWFAMSHLAATNLAVWVRIVVMETANDWMYHVPHFIEDKLQLNQQNEMFLNISNIDRNLNTMDDAMKLFICLHNSTLGNMWEETMPYLYPFIIKFSWLSCAIFYTIRGSLQNNSSHNSGENEHFSIMTRKGKQESDSYKSLFTKTGRRYYFRIDCRGSSKGLFAGLFLLIGNIIVIVLFYVLRSKEEYEFQVYLATLGSYGIILLLGIIGVTIGYFTVRNGLSESFHRKSRIDSLLSSVSLTGKKACH
ncbi:Proton channel OtopLc [Nymphon striatum]|nr:Proton channel OtopLc [Nymphon striatum]